jgi:hypothetical protein
VSRARRERAEVADRGDDIPLTRLPGEHPVKELTARAERARRPFDPAQLDSRGTDLAQLARDVQERGPDLARVPG